jgi:hypothetical protein
MKDTTKEPEEEEAEREPSTAKVRIRRVFTDEAGEAVEPVTGLTVIDAGELRHWHPDPDEDEFEVDAATADAAVKTGGFEVMEESRVQLKKH